MVMVMITIADVMLLTAKVMRGMLLKIGSANVFTKQENKNISDVISLKMSASDLQVPGYWTTHVGALTTTS